MDSARIPSQPRRTLWVLIVAASLAEVWLHLHPARSEAVVTSLRAFPRPDPTTFALVGVVENHSTRYRLTSFRVLLTVRNSPTEQPDFKDPNILAKTEVEFYCDVRPGGAEVVSTLARLGYVPPPRGNLAWGWKVLSAR